MHRNNFDFLRLIFAIFVIVSHSYPISGADITTGWMHKLTDGQVELSYIGVRGFFIISGFLIFQSLVRSRNVLDYYWKRILRLFPALFVVLVLTVMLGPLVYESPIPYFKNHDVLTYLPNNIILFRIQHTIAGVFENLPFKSAINGSLWTITYEFTLYILLSFLFVFKKNMRMIHVILIVSFLFLFISKVFFDAQLGKHHFLSMGGSSFLDLGAYFVGGSLMASFEMEKLKINNLAILLGLLLLCLSIYFHAFRVLQYFSMFLIVFSTHGPTFLHTPQIIIFFV